MNFEPSAQQLSLTLKVFAQRLCIVGGIVTTFLVLPVVVLYLVTPQAAGS